MKRKKGKLKTFQTQSFLNDRFSPDLQLRFELYQKSNMYLKLHVTLRVYF